METSPSPTARARNLRRHSTEPERRFWSRLRNGQVGGVKYRRQVAIGSYIVDFVALAVGLVVEVDGDTHALTGEADAARSAFLEKQGYHVIRFGNTEVMENIEGVLEEIMAVAHCPSPSLAVGLGPSLSPMGERGQ